MAKQEKRNEQDLSIAGSSENVSHVVEEAERKETTKKRLLEGLNIGISISEGEDTSLLGFSDVHQRYAMIEFARQLLISGATLVYGGDLRTGGYTELFAELSFQYRNRKDKDRYPFRNYFSYPIHLNLNKAHRSEFKKNRVQIVEVGPDGEVTMDKPALFNTKNPETKVVWASSLTKMRTQMNQETNARIFMGGRNYGFLGKYPGIVEEALIAVESEKPIYLVGAFGGATKRMIEAIQQKKPVIVEADEFYQSDSYRSFKIYSIKVEV